MGSSSSARVNHEAEGPKQSGARPGWTRFVCISDTHSHVCPVPPGDVLIHAGDLSSWGSLAQLKLTIDWLMTLPHPTKIIIAGNHDARSSKIALNVGLQDVEKARSIMKSEAVRNAGIHYLEYESMDLTTATGKTWKIYGSPACPRYAPGCFQYTTEDEAKEIYSRIPQDTEILLTHTPPHGMLDLSRKGTHAGCKTLSRRLEELTSCRLHVFGHIHEASGVHINPAEGRRPERVSVNGAVVWGHQVAVVDLEDF
ncbi:hypothetical protein EW146_g4911 [Bondarzewia mesenterica]|uniref:Calcineurin-like phosphoesterase domain-containing protein n=1 Tax=Bondarzewia mesenterica TaxID=1095465 RepID=A0A4S4LUX7_9AGAM|nr:hypothetical protein EW146_g4911 [Bondarzewia mesenterica]